MINAGDTAWVAASTALVLFMTLPGLAMFYGGLVRTRNVLSVFMQCFALASAVSILWYAAGYSLAFSGGGPFIGDFELAGFSGVVRDSVTGSIPTSLFSLYQMTFAIITPALIVGGFAERVRFGAMLVFSLLWTMVVYVPVAHWVWGGGWLSQYGVYDFAGGIVVHITAGIASLVSALLIGPRKGFGSSAILPHNTTMVLAGAGMLWVGWFGFNGGSALAANGQAAMAMLVTHLSAAAGAAIWAGIEWIKFGKPSAVGIATGMVAGLGTITPASGFVGPSGAIAIGMMAGAICFYATYTIKQVLKIDDSLDVFPVHGVGGILGSLAVGVFCAPALGGAGFASGIQGITAQLQSQAIGVAATIAYTAGGTWIIWKLIGAILPIRVSTEVENNGLDEALHGEPGYNM